MNDTTRQVGGALGVAILGSVLASAYATSIRPVVADSFLPAAAAAASSDSIGGALAVAAQLGDAGAALADAAKSAFIDGMQVAIWAALGVALAGAAVTGIFLPARPRAERTLESHLHEATSIQT